MLAHYARVVDTSHEAAFLWGRGRGVLYANDRARKWTGDLVQAAAIAEVAQDVVADARAILRPLADASFLFIPIIGADGRVGYVFGIAGRQLEDMPHLLHALHQSPRHFSQIVHLLPQIVLTARPDGTFDYASKQWYKVTGSSILDLDLGSSLKAAIGANFAAFERSWQRGVASSERFAFELALNTADSGIRWYELQAVPWLEQRTILKWIVSLDDVHERKIARGSLDRIHRRLEAIADIGTLALDTTLTPESFVQSALDCASNALGYRWIAVLALPEGKSVIASGSSPVPDDSETAVHRVPFDFGESGSSELVVVRDAPADFDDIDARIVRDVAWRLGNALRNLYALRRETRVARVLQLGMLPLTLPQSPTVTFDVSYAPAASEALVGGDWYDAFYLPDGKIAFSIGDVSGHGLDAAVVMGHVREMMRAFTLLGARPSAVMSEANEIVNSGGYGLISAFLGFLDPKDGSIDYANAGHPYPLLVRADGVVEAVAGGDILLGAMQNVAFRTRRMRLAPGSALVLYTDGLVEFSRDAAAGEAVLRSVLEEWVAGDFGFGASEIVSRTLGGTEPSDDIAALIVRSIGRSVSSPPTEHGMAVQRNERRTVPRSAAHSRS